MTHRRGPWSQGEDAYLVQLVNTQGPLNWVRIAQLIGSRSPKQCRERYHQNLKPSLNHEPITPEEGSLIERLVGEIGKRWAEIARRLNGRSDNAVKNWWNGSINRHRRLVLRRRQHPPTSKSFNAHNARRPNPLLLRTPGANIRPLHIIPDASYALGPNDGPLSSPCESIGSRAESLEGPPSLVSDTGSVYSASPHIMTSPVIALPPLDSVPCVDRRPSYPVIFPDALSTNRSAYDSFRPEPPQPKQHQHQDIAHIPSLPPLAWPLTPPVSQVHLPRPPTSREILVERDSRMELSMLLG